MTAIRTAGLATLICTAFLAAPAASATPASHWVPTDAHTTGIATGINNAGDVVTFDPKYDSYRLLRAGGTPLDLQPPHLSRLTPSMVLVGPNDAGQSATTYMADSGRTRTGIFDRDGHFTALADPEHARVVDINDNGVVIGTTQAVGHEHAVHWTRHGVPLDVDTGTRDVRPTGMNDHGQFAAWVETAVGRRGAVYDRQGHLLRYLHRTPGEESDQPGDINDNGVVIGSAEIPDPGGGPMARVPVRWGNLGRAHQLAAPVDATSTHIASINDHGLIVGYVTYPDADGGSGQVNRAAVWRSPQDVELLTAPPESVPPGEPSGRDVEADALNNSNVLAGFTVESDYAELVIWNPAS